MPLGALRRPRVISAERCRSCCVRWQQHEVQSIIETKFAADDEWQFLRLRFDMGANDAGQRTFVGDGQRRVTELLGAMTSSFGARCAAKKVKLDRQCSSA